MHESAPSPVVHFYAALAADDAVRISGLLAPGVRWRGPRRGGARGIQGAEAVLAFLCERPPSVAHVRVRPKRVRSLRHVELVSGAHEIRLVNGEELLIPFIHSWRVRDGRLASLLEVVPPPVLELLRRRGLQEDVPVRDQ